MKSKFISVVIIFIALMQYGCSSNQTTQIGDNTFVHDGKVYKIVDNEINEIGEINSKVRKFEVLKPMKKDYGEATLSYVRENANASLDALYRGNILYFNLTINGLNDLKEKFYPGQFTINFLDEYGFIIHKTEIPTSELIGMVGENKEVHYYVYNGKTEMSSDINKAIKTYSVTAAIKAKSASAYTPWSY